MNERVRELTAVAKLSALMGKREPPHDGGWLGLFVGMVVGFVIGYLCGALFG